MFTYTNEGRTVYTANTKDFDIFEGSEHFYTPKNLTNFDGTFTLPKGTFTSTVQLWKIEDNNINRPSFELPPYERDLKHDWSEFAIKFADNINKCTIDHDNKTVTFDYSFEHEKRAVFDFILYHEQGHNFYGNGESEYKCDLFAIYHMLNDGYPPSIIWDCPIDAQLKNGYRLNKIFETLLNN